MNESNHELELFDLKGLVARINEGIADPRLPVGLGNFIEKNPKKNPFLYGLRKWSDEEAEFTGKYQISQPWDLPFVHLLNLNGKRGYIFVERGVAEASASEPGEYERIRLVVKEPIEMVNGVVIPRCSIKILKEEEEGCAPYVDRRDHIRLGLFWKRTDLSKVLPTEWFFYDNK